MIFEKRDNKKDFLEKTFFYLYSMFLNIVSKNVLPLHYLPKTSIKIFQSWTRFFSLRVSVYSLRVLSSVFLSLRDRTLETTDEKKIEEK